MSIDVVVQVALSCAVNVLLETSTLMLLHHNGHFCLLERSIRDFLHLERQLEREYSAKPQSFVSTSISSSFEDYYDAKPSFYPSQRLGNRLAIALETFLRQLTANSELLATSLALKMFIHGSVLTNHMTIGQSYREAVEAELEANEQPGNEMIEERVAAGSSVEHQVVVDVKEDKKLVLWKFVSQGTGLVFSALFSSGDPNNNVETNPYSIRSDDGVEDMTNEKEVAHYKTNCNFMNDDKYVYGHYVADKNGIVTLLWENVDMDTVISKSLHFQVKVVSMSAGEKVLEIADSLKTVDTDEWLCDYMAMSEFMSVKDLVGWESYDMEDVFAEDTVCDDGVAGDTELESQIKLSALEQCNQELQAQVVCLEKSLVTTKKELRSARDRVQIAEEIYKANLETITHLECATGSDTAPKTLKVATTATTESQSGTLHLNDAQMKETPSNELKRMQNLCAGFQEQCLWRSVENMELEAQLAASQVEMCSLRERYVEQATQLEEYENQNDILRKHKKILVQEVKRLQPYSQVNLAALVQEAQEARMVQRSLQAKLDSHELFVSSMSKVDAIESERADFVFVEASEDEL